MLIPTSQKRISHPALKRKQEAHLPQSKGPFTMPLVSQPHLLKASIIDACSVRNEAASGRGKTPAFTTLFSPLHRHPPHLGNKRKLRVTEVAVLSGGLIIYNCASSFLYFSPFPQVLPQCLCYNVSREGGWFSKNISESFWIILPNECKTSFMGVSTHG